MKIILSLLIFSICFSSCKWMQEHQYEGDIESEPYERNINSPTNGMPSEPGKCYARCLIHDHYITESVVIYEYTGLHPSETDGVKYHSITIKEATTEWEKVKAKKNSNSKDPNDDLVWCIKEVPSETVDYFIVTDTTSIKTFKQTTVFKKILDKPGGYTEWNEILCAADVTKNIYRNIQLALVDNGYDVKTDGIIHKATKEALIHFQKENNLPIGALSFKTLEKLGVRF